MNSKRLPITVTLLVTVLCLAGCATTTANPAKKTQGERVVEISSSAKGVTSISAETHNGSISIRGDDTGECRGTATIKVKAPNDESVSRIDRQVRVHVDRCGSSLSIRIEKPKLKRRESISVDLDVVVPKVVSVAFETHNGGAKVSGVSEATGDTHNGSIKLHDISGDVRAETHNGSISCENVGDHVDLQTHNGSVKLTRWEAIRPDCQITTHNGSISSDLPILVSGKLKRGRLRGTIGEGEGRLALSTHNGGVSIR